MEKSFAGYVPVINRSGSYKLDVSDISLITRYNRKLEFSTNEGKLYAYDKLDNIAGLLNGYFVECMSGCYVNIERIKEIKNDTVFFDDGTEFHPSKKPLRKIKQLFNSYLRNLYDPSRPL